MRELLEADRRLYFSVHSRWRARWLDPVMVGFTRAGTKGILWLGLCAGLVIDGSVHARWAAVSSVVALLLGEGLINVILKPAIRRERPFVGDRSTALLVGAPGPHSWPSAHAGSSAAAATVLAYAYPRAAPVLVAIALLIAYSRVYVGVHYPLDVIAGLVLGVLCGIVVIVGLNILDPTFHTAL